MPSSLPIKTISRNSSYLVYFFKICPKILDILKWKCKAAAILMTSQTFTNYSNWRTVIKTMVTSITINKLTFSDLINTIELSVKLVPTYTWVEWRNWDEIAYLYKTQIHTQTHTYTHITKHTYTIDYNSILVQYKVKYTILRQGDDLKARWLS